MSKSWTNTRCQVVAGDRLIYVLFWPVSETNLSLGICRRLLIHSSSYTSITLELLYLRREKTKTTHQKQLYMLANQKNILEAYFQNSSMDVIGPPRTY